MSIKKINDTKVFVNYKTGQQELQLYIKKKSI